MATINRNNNQAGFLLPMTSLYVGDLHPDVTEALLYEKFSPAGQILSLRVCRDSRTKLSLGYAYVNFSNSEDAERVLDTMNFDMLKGKPIRMMWCQRDPSLRKSGIGNVFIKNLDKSIDNKAMYDTFSAFGNILSCKVALDDNGMSKGYGFVHFESIEAAKKAIEKVNGMLLNGKKVYVGKFIPKIEREKQLGARTKTYTNIYIKNFGKNMTDDQLYRLFEKFGKITSYVVMKNADGTSKGFGFVSFEDPWAAEKAVLEMNNYEYQENRLYVGRAQKKTERAQELKKNYEEMKLELFNRKNNNLPCSRVQGANLYVKNLDDSFDNEKLIRVFSPYGTITSAKVMTESGRSKGFGFVCFSSPEEATKAIQELDGKMIGTKPMYVALAQRYEDRRAYLASQVMQRLRFQMSLPSTPPFYIPTIPQGPRFFNHLNQIRPASRWSNPPLPRLNGAYNITMPPHPPQIFRQVSRPMINGRNNVYPRPITGMQPISQSMSRPKTPINKNNTTTANNNNNNNISMGNGGDANNNNNSNNSNNKQAMSEEKQMLGERMYSVIEKTNYEKMAGKITGMLLEMDTAELRNLVNHHDQLMAKVEEAVAVLEAHQNQNSAGNNNKAAINNNNNNNNNKNSKSGMPVQD